MNDAQVLISLEFHFNQYILAFKSEWSFCSMYIIAGQSDLIEQYRDRE
jgi:hypothetical protein